MPVTGSARGETSRTRPVARDLRVGVSDDSISGLGGAWSFTTRGTSKTASRPPWRAMRTIMRPGRDHLARLGAAAVTVPDASATSSV